MNSTNIQKQMICLANDLGELLLQHQWRVTTAESCTGGGLAQAITDIAGSSQWFELGFITYSNEAKQRQLGVDRTLLATAGAVSSETTEAMVLGALNQAGADIGVAVSGIAGPGGGTTQKPVGTVWISWSLSEGCPTSACYTFSGDRHEVREQAVISALEGLIQLIQKNTV